MVGAKGYIGLTDPEWYAYLAAHPHVDEVNFWQPHGGRAFRVLKRGEPFFFKLRAPDKAIAGFGFFERHETLPAWLAWESFGEMNGAADFVSMMDRILRLRGEAPSADRRAVDFDIGCVMLAAPVFFAPSEWIEPPRDWAKTGIQQGKTYTLDSGEGARVFSECMRRAAEGTRYWNVEQPADRVAEQAARYGKPIEVRPRLGQGLFRLNVSEAYGWACAVTREHSRPVLDAAHIKPYGMGGQHAVDNGLLLRSDIHRLFDLGYVTVTPDHRFQVSDSLAEEYHNGRVYYQLRDQAILLPQSADQQPSRELLDWHGQAVYRG